MPCVSDAIATPAFFLDAETRLASVPANNTWAFCETLHALCAGLAHTDAFNVAYWSEKDQTLHFPYNFDDGVMDVPVIWPLGDGPTSWVIRSGKPLVLTLDDKPPFQKARYWGRSQKPSVSSIHLPMRAWNRGSDPPLVGVLSSHAYSRVRYTPEIVASLQWLADRAGSVYQTGRILAEAQQAAIESASKQRDHQKSKTELCNQVAHLLHDLSTTAHQIAENLQSSSNPQAPKAFDLARRLYSAQAEVTMLPTGILPTERAHELPGTQSECFTPAEMGVVQGLLDGCSNKEIAEHLHLSVATVKFHVHSIYQKLGATSRSKAVHLLNSLHRASKNESLSDG